MSEVSDLLAGRQKAQILLCNEDERAALQALYPPFLVLCPNGEDDPSVFAGRRVATSTVELAEWVLPGNAEVLKALIGRPPDGFTTAQNLAWARATAQPYPFPAEESIAQPEPPTQADAHDLGAEPATTGEGASGARTDNVAMPAEPPQDGSAPLLSTDEPPEGDPDEFLSGADKYLSTGSPEPLMREYPSVWEDRARDGWPNPVDFWEASHLPEHDYALYPPEVAAWIDDYRETTGCSGAMIGLNVRVALGGILDGRIRVAPKPDDPWTEPAILWGVTCGESGIGKGPSARAIIRAIYGHEHDIRKLDETARRDYEFALERYQEDRAKARKAGGARPEPPERPQIARLITENFTTEKISEIAEENYRQHLLIYKEELSGMWGQMDAYSAGKAVDKDRPYILQLYEGQPATIDRRGANGQRGSLFVRSLGASILGGVQPSTLARIVYRGHFTEDGMMARFMVVHGEPQVEGAERPPDKLINASFQRLIDRLISLTAGSQAVQLSPGANERRLAFSRWARKLIASDLPPGMGAHVAKWEALACRLALADHAIQCAAQNMPMIAPEITGETFERVARYLTEFLLHHSFYFYERTLATPENSAQLERVAAILLLHGGDVFSTSDMGSHYSGYWKMPPANKRALWSALEAAGWVRGVPGSMNADRFCTRYAVSPLARDGRYDKWREEWRARRKAERARQIQKMPTLRHLGELGE